MTALRAVDDMVKKVGMTLGIGGRGGGEGGGPRVLCRVHLLRRRDNGQHQKNFPEPLNPRFSSSLKP
jgi:hypothetical protein